VMPTRSGRPEGLTGWCFIAADVAQSDKCANKIISHGWLRSKAFGE